MSWAGRLLLFIFNDIGSYSKILERKDLAISILVSVSKERKNRLREENGEH